MQQLRSLTLKAITLTIALAFTGISSVSASNPQHGEEHEVTEEHHDAHAHEAEKAEFNAKDMILHHIQDAHDWHFFDIPQGDGTSKPVSLPLPVILIYNGQFDVFLSSEFHHGHSPVTRGDVTYVLHHNEIYVANEHGELDLDEAHHATNEKPLDFSITKNVTSMLITMVILFLLFSTAAKSYKKNNGVPKGIAGFLEPLILFVRDDIAKPNIGEKKYKRYMPYLLTVFFFIWINNLFGLIPVLAPNLTGNIAVTLVLALMTLLITYFSGNKDYWGHIFWMPGVPTPIRFILAPIELIGTLTKPFALMVRLFANITAGHILILSLVSIIFVLKSVAMSGLSIPFMVFMNTLELLVAALQAYIFTLLSALFIGMAVEEHDHH
ncbi:MAG: ATP synthase F0 subunit A [Crocinitomicaceae bacterium]|nr:ATP synthase F0 subunit A [Crocinitomicaceae bacterium]|tara:strand:+ start:10852 stop:11994 length:1143 start_codon:yes stop_codon:yes gene_type:complete